jgi:Transposase DDE domain
MSHILSSNKIEFADYKEIFSYYVIDEYLKNCGCHVETKCSASGDYPKLSDAEVIFVFFMSFSNYGGNYAKAMSSLFNAGFIKNKLSRGQFSTRIYKLYSYIFQIYYLFSEIAKQNNKKFSLDTFPLSVCHNIRIKRCKILKDERYRGYNSSKKQYFYGFKVHLITAADGIVTEFEFSPGSVEDLAGYNLLNFDLPKGSELNMDKAYNFYQKEDLLREIALIKPNVIRKSNSRKEDNTPYENYIKQVERRHIETNISQIERLFPEKIHVTNETGFYLKILGFILAYNMELFFKLSANSINI